MKLFRTFSYLLGILRFSRYCDNSNEHSHLQDHLTDTQYHIPNIVSRRNAFDLRLTDTDFRSNYPSPITAI